MNPINAPEAPSADFLLGLEFGNLVRIPMNDRPAVYQDPETGALLGVGGAVALVESTPYVNMTATGTAFTGPCELAGYDCTVAAGNITIYDGTSAAGTVIVPTTPLSVGRVEFNFKRALQAGCHVVLSGAATVNVLVG